MANEEWLEIRARTQEAATAAALAEMGLDSPNDVDVEVVEEPQRGVFGLGGRDGLFRVAKKTADAPKKRRRSRGSKVSGGGAGSSSGEGKPASGARGRPTPSQDPRPSSGTAKKPVSRGERREDRDRPSGRDTRQKPPAAPKARKEEAANMPDLEEQTRVVSEFLTGLLDAFGLEGSVETRLEGEDIIIANVTGEQTEALVGAKGAILQAILELTRTVVQRKTQAGARIRLDIAGYTERRREALKVYASRLVEQVCAEGEEVMLEPMNPADRKVVHDVVAENDGVRSYSEGEEPYRSVVISPMSE